ncbi:yippee zinc-binding/DNA-binding /Mis18, centromere assembly domain-containing protein [Sarocladium implicatum]|nr:yippee zinc-binding/DNA-binding /Mis18, centromere assembly domain-containing protein [Sarocladium implicatum]
MVRESGISATKPVFPNFLLPSFRLPFTRRRSSASSELTDVLSSDDEPGGSYPSSADTTPNSSPPTHTNTVVKPGNRLSRTERDTLRCGSCSTDLAFASQIVSKGFTGRHGRAFLVGPVPGQQSLLNLRVGRNENRQLVTGWHVVADISCGICSTKLGWKYVDAKESSQKYKIGKFILEVQRVVTYRSWEYEEDQAARPEEEDGKVVEGRRSKGAATSEGEDDDEEIIFDSDDEDECEDVFAGTWDPETVAQRRRSMGAARRKSTAG